MFARRSLIVLVAFLWMTPVAHADCGNTIVDDYLTHGAVTGHYSQTCYAQALAEIPHDAAAYTDIVASITAAQQRDRPAQTATVSVLSGPNPVTGTTPAKKRKAAKHPEAKTATQPQSVIPLAQTTPRPPTSSTSIAPQALSVVAPKSTNQVPTAVVVVGVVAALLIAVGVGGLVTVRRRRRLTPD